MTVRLGDLRFDGWESLELPGGWSDTFILRTSPRDGLPPGDYARVIRSLTFPVMKLRKSASLWVRVEGEGRWYAQVLRDGLRGMRMPVVVTNTEDRPQLWDFSFAPWVSRSPSPGPPTAEAYLKEERLSQSGLRCLQILARADCGYTAEVASLAGLSLAMARISLQDLTGQKLVERLEGKEYPYWKIRRSGLSMTLRSWGLPPGQSFPRRKEQGRSACEERTAPKGNSRNPGGMEAVSFIGKRRGSPRRKDEITFQREVQSDDEVRRASSGRHRRTARLWPAWLRKAWPQAEIWAGWSEVVCGRLRPDALCWGRLEGQETLFWLEVESGHDDGRELREKTVRRINQALVYARQFPVRLVFALLGPPRVSRELLGSVLDLPGDVAIVVEDWKNFGMLPVIEWGKVKWG
jgi:hypothetical protein